METSTLKEVKEKVKKEWHKWLNIIEYQTFQCLACGWKGILYNCEPDIDGEGNPGCPECGRVVQWINQKKEK